MKNLRHIFAGAIVAIITFLYWLLIMTFGDEFRRAYSEYWSEITLFFIVSSIIVNVTLIYVFYNTVKLKDKLSLFFISLPFLLVLIIADIMSQNIPRLLDIVFIVLGSILIYKISNIKTEVNRKPVLILASYLLAVSVSYPFLYNLLETNFCKI